MYENHKFTPDSKEFGAVVKGKNLTTSSNPYQTPPTETNSTPPQTSSIKRKTNLAIIISNFASEISRPLSNGKINNSPQNILKFLNEVFKRSKCSKENAVLATFYFQKIYQSNIGDEPSLPEFSRCSKRIFLSCLIPVSYTHLDVYKRQQFTYVWVDHTSFVSTHHTLLGNTDFTERQRLDDIRIPANCLSYAI